MPITLPIPPATARRLVIPDIHGCLKTFMALLARIDLTPADQLFLLGDYVNRGPDSLGVVDAIMSLQERGYSVYALQGNHEEMLLDDLLTRPDDTWVKFEYGHFIQEKYIQFFSQLPYYFEIDGYFLVHAGFNFLNDPWNNTEAMLWIRDIKPDLAQMRGKRIVHGHDLRLLEEITQAIKNNAPCIGLDNGCVQTKYGDVYGRLLCLDLDSLELHIQKNVEKGTA